MERINTSGTGTVWRGAVLALVGTLQTLSTADVETVTTSAGQGHVVEDGSDNTGCALSWGSGDTDRTVKS